MPMPIRLPSILLCLTMTLPCLAARHGPPAEPWAALPDDREASRQVTVTTAAAEYTVTMDATVDGTMTQGPIGYAAYVQGWQPNHWLRLENTGDTDVVNPWLTVDDRGPWRTLGEVATRAVDGCTEDRERARAVWEFLRRRRFHATTWDGECQDTIKVLNVYGYTLCGDDAQVITDLWKAVGLRTRRGYPVGHCVAEAFYDGEFHLLDGDEHGIYLRRDNETIASEADVVRDHDLIKRTHTYGILAGDSRHTDEFSASLFGYRGERQGEHGGHSRHAMDFTLRPGESLEWRWGHIGKQYTAGTDLHGEKWTGNGQGDLRAWGPVAYAKLSNGKLRYAPDLTQAVCRRGLAESANLAPPDPAGMRPAAAGQPAVAVWRISSPHVIVGATVSGRFRRAAADDGLRLAFSRDGRTWEPLWSAEATGTLSPDLVLDERLSPCGRPDYVYYVRLEMTTADPAAVAAERIVFDTDVQMSTLALPELVVGPNRVRYRDDNPGPHQVSITHAWVERRAWRPPAAPEPLSPADGTTVPGTQVAFSWQPASHPDSVPVVDYHIEISGYPDMRWPLSPNVEKLVSLTPSKGSTGWTVPYVGLLNPETTYYWHVRAKDSRGVWGPWSRVCSFRPDAPGVPLDVKATADPAAATVLLTWGSNPKGAAAVEYIIYASDERGFTASDTEYAVRMGRGFCRSMDEFQAKAQYQETVKTSANRLGTTAAREQLVAGPGLASANANRCYYRVVAVDARGLCSGPSDYAEAPRPFICSRPAERATAGQLFVYEPQCVRSIGDLLCRDGFNHAFWDAEAHAFALVAAPPWLRLDAATGQLSGVPPADGVGRHSVTLRVSDDRQHSAEQTFSVTVVAP